MISVLLINPPITVPITGRRVIAPPLGLAYLASVLLEGHFEVRILDCVAEGSMREDIVEPGFVRVGLTPDEIEMRITNDPPAVAAIACVSSDQVHNARLVAECAKNLRQRKLIDITTVVGGPGFTAQPYEVMQDYNIDFGILGEGEIPFFQLCQALYQRGGWEEVPGVVHRDRLGGVTVNPVGPVVEDLDLIPMPARQLLNMHYYTYGPSYYGEAMTPHTSMVLSRGCPSQCVYCAVPRMFGTTLRKRSTGRIFDELEFLKNEYVVREVELIGDNLFHDRDWAHEWMGQIVETGLNMKWSPMSGQSLHNFDLETAEMAIASGMRSVFLDITAGDIAVYDRVYKRPGDLSGLAELVRFLKRNKVYVGGLFTLGAPGETRESMRSTIRLAFGLGLHEIEFRAMTPFPGTPLWDQCAQENLFELVPGTPELLRDFGYIVTDDFTARHVRWLRDWARMREESRQMVAHPGRLVGGAAKLAIQTVFHPFTALRTIWRFVRLATGTPLAEPTTGPRAARGGTPAKAAADDEF